MKKSLANIDCRVDECLGQIGEAGVPTVGIGPGNEKWAHTPQEHVGIALLKRACRIWTGLIVRVCGVASGQSGNFTATVVPYKPV